MQIDEILDQIYPLSVNAKNLLKENILEVSYPKNHILLRADRTEHSFFFVKKGVARAYSNQDGNEVTFWFGVEGSTLMSIKSYVQAQPSYENIELLENCELYQLKNEKLQELFLEDIHIANWGRKFAELELIKAEERLISLQYKSATERYKELLKNHPDLFQRVQLGHIASYLGITQVSLSRIRAEIG